MGVGLRPPELGAFSPVAGSDEPVDLDAAAASALPDHEIDRLKFGRGSDRCCMLLAVGRLAAGMLFSRAAARVEMSRPRLGVSSRSPDAAAFAEVPEVPRETRRTMRARSDRGAAAVGAPAPLSSSVGVVWLGFAVLGINGMVSRASMRRRAWGSTAE